MQKTLSVRIDKRDYEFVKKLAKDNKEEVSKAIRHLVDKGRVMYAIDSYKKGHASLGKASALAGLSISEMMDVLTEFGVRSKISYEDYLEGLNNLRKHW
ncbi:UPF0175 family protein [Candidatus Woesearchaeota archaeon]|nr:UPF0175 family protein [Candidatus Woesearchaeota archaeon]